MGAVARKWWRAAGVVLAAWVGVVHGPVHAQEPLPLQAFFGAPTIGSATLSPSGRWVAATVKSPEGRMRLVVSDLDNKEPARVVAAFSKVDVQMVRWVNEDWLVFDTLDRIDHSRHRRGSGLLSVRRDGEQLRLLIKREWETEFPATGTRPLEANYRYIRNGAPGTNEIVIGEARFDANWDFVAEVPHLLDVSTGERRIMLDDLPDTNTRGWFFDSAARARAALTVKGDEVRVLWRESPAGKSWKEIGKFKRLNMHFAPSFLDDKDQLFVEQVGSDGFERLSRFDPASGSIVEPPLATTPGFSDSIEPITRRGTGELIGLTITTDAAQQIWLTPGMKEVQAKVDAALPGRVNLLQCAPCDQPKVVLVHSYSDRHAGEYLVFRPQENKWQQIGARRADVDPRRMAGLEFHRAKARDGADLPVWITRPQGAAGAARPAVVMVHGGPWVRGVEWGWNNEAQFLASRGYVVIEPEFRGSKGYGDRHFRAGWKQYGQSMQDDVEDAVRFAVSKGGVDASKVCIYGGSYGGYATLMGLAKHPDTYRCGVAFAAVTDPMLMFTAHWSDMSQDTREHSLAQMVGDPKKDADMLRANAPVEKADRIKAPVLLMHGFRDRRVPIDHGERMRDAMRKAGNAPEWVVYDDEGHGMSKIENEIDMWRRIEAFLAKHLK